MKKVIVFFLSLLSFISLFSCNRKSGEKELMLVMAEVNPEGTISAEMDTAFKNKVEELSEGKIKIDIQFMGTLGDEETVLNVMTKPGSSIHLQRISTFNLVPRGCEKSSLLTIPFTFKDREHFWKFAESETAQEILNEPYEKGVGVKGLFYGEEGFRHFFSNKKIENPSDFEGLNLRITSDKVMKGVAKGLKTVSCSVPFGDLYMALQTGRIDAAEQPLANYLANKFHHVAPFMVLDGHTLGVTEVVIASECWDSLSKKQQEILMEAGKYAGEVCRKISQDAEEKSKELLKMEGAQFAEVNDLSPWQEASKNIIGESAKINPELYQEILSLAK